MRASIVTGDVNGMMLSQKLSVLSGLLMVPVRDISAITSGRLTGSMNCCVSDSLSTIAPMAANMAL